MEAVAMKRRLGASESSILVAQSNLANTYEALDRKDLAMSMRRDVYSGRLKLQGDEHPSTLIAAKNYALSFYDLKRFEETRALLRKTIPVARRVLGENHEIMVWMRWTDTRALLNQCSMLGDLREAVDTAEELETTARRVLGGAHPTTSAIEHHLLAAREALAAHEAGPGKSVVFTTT